MVYFKISENILFQWILLHRQTIQLRVFESVFYLMFIAHASIHTFHTRKHLLSLALSLTSSPFMHPLAHTHSLTHTLTHSLLSVTRLSFSPVCFSVISIVQISYEASQKNSRGDLFVKFVFTNKRPRRPSIFHSFEQVLIPCCPVTKQINFTFSDDDGSLLPEA